MAELVQDPVHLVRQDLLLVDRPLDVARRLDPVVLEVLEEAVHHLLLEVELEGLLPAHHPLREHVVHHSRDEGDEAIAAPEPLVEPRLHDGEVVLVLLEHELDGLEAEGHVPRLVGLRREPEGHRGQVAVERGPGHEGHEQQVRQQVLEREPDGDQPLERARRQRVVEERLRAPRGTRRGRSAAPSCACRRSTCCSATACGSRSARDAARRGSGTGPRSGHRGR